MVRVGLCTVSFSTVSVDEALAIAAGAGAPGIELWGRGHLPEDAPHKEVARVQRLIESQGLEIAAYGSYARAGDAAWTSERFAGIIARAVDLGAPRIRVWAGATGSADAQPDDWTQAAATLTAWGELAAARGVQLVVERHNNSLTDFGDAALRLFTLIPHPAVRLNYQAPYPWTEQAYCAELADDLRRYLPLSAHMHVQNFTRRDDGLVQVPVAEGLINFAMYDPLLAEAQFDGWAMLEFLPDIPEISKVALARRELASLGRLLDRKTGGLEI
ncbi:MAG TPA: TIM barrel protein [Armatimonadota bacterium]|jgi:sugar phosphate isomerase/epimerase